MEGMFKGAGWLSLIALAAGASLTFVPDKTWESFPEPLAPVRAKLAAVGIAPEKYRKKDEQPEIITAEPAPRDQCESSPEYESSVPADLSIRSGVRIRKDLNRTLAERDAESENSVQTSPLRDRFANPAVAPANSQEPRPSIVENDLFSDPIFDSGSDAGAPSAPANPAAQTFDRAPATPTAPAAPSDFSPFSDADALLGGTNANPATANPATANPAGANPVGVANPNPGAPVAEPLQSAGNAPSQFSADGLASFTTAQTPPASETTPEALATTTNPVAPFPEAALGANNPAPAPAAAPDSAAANVSTSQNYPAPSAATNIPTPATPALTPNSARAALATAPTAPTAQIPQTQPQTQPQASTQPPQAVFTAPQAADGAPQNALQQPPTTLQGAPANLPQTNAISAAPTQTMPIAQDCLTAPTCSALLAQGNVEGSLDAALRSAQNLQSADQVVEVFVTLNRLRPYYCRSDQAQNLDRINRALDRLSYDVLYNRELGILEPLYQTKSGETVASLARDWDVTPETVKAINCIEIPDDSPLPPGTTLKVVRGPVTVEVSSSRKELLLKFNNLYAGRFPCGVPQQAAGLRGEYVVENKIQNPSCKAVDMQGAEVVIEGGAKDNPLGSCWIGLNGGYGFQGTNRPELVGASVPERSGFVFSNLHISQLDLMTPVGATVKFVD